MKKLILILVLVISSSFVRRERIFWVVGFKLKSLTENNTDYFGGKIIEAATWDKALIIFKNYCKKENMALENVKYQCGYYIRRITEKDILK